MRAKYPLDTPLPTIDFGSLDLRIQPVFYKNGITTLRQLCQMSSKNLTQYTGIGKNSFYAIEKTIQAIGLELDMTEKEIADYERSFNNADENPTVHNEIDWEARRYELAKELYLRKPTHTEATALDAFIEADTLVDVVAGFGSEVFYESK